MGRAAALFVAAAFAAGASVARAEPEVWRLDADQTRVHFEVQHFGTSTSRGRFGAITGSIALDRAARRGDVSITVATASVSTGLAPFDSVLRGSDLLASAEHPQAWFVASHLGFDGDQLVRLDGEFTLRGISRPLTLHALRFACRDDAARGREVCGGDFEGELRRSDFGMNFGLPFVADRVRLLVQVEAIRD
jgi:polyisoprenoid-binding protein YceI